MNESRRLRIAEEERPRGLPARTAASLTARVTERIRNGILDADFGLGEALSEDRLASAMGVSRTPVRDALTALQAQGLIEIRPQRGSYVFMPTRDDVAQLCVFRSVLEVQAIGLSAAGDRETMLSRMRRAVKNMDVAKERGDFVALSRADTDFHEALVDGSSNKYLIESYRMFSGRFVAVRTHVLLALGETRTRSMSEHRAIISALDKGEAALAQSILSAHIAKALDGFDLATQRGFLAESQRKTLRATVK